ncbi:hypothetical protein CYMTET_34690 [Cymbomonas tetramitiformis]|uniref:Uncharacterized protein n=1 Tax=Cymbomonas tetramitiformis TaxID=36881 RepID=A0AAE0FAJ6_9CHLO|nr:hypothetical protein CYMTET_34690 [Cymbomonas tetramitiformis]
METYDVRCLLTRAIAFARLREEAGNMPAASPFFALAGSGDCGAGRFLLGGESPSSSSDGDSLTTTFTIQPVGVDVLLRGGVAMVN